MQNIPTELLRAFVTVIDLKGFTRAGERLGRSQPAISLQIKRLQDLLGFALFDRENGNSVLTDHGRLVEIYARRILSINDELIAKIAAHDLRGCIRIGVPMEFADPLLAHLLSQDWARKTELTFDVVCDTASNLIAGVKEGAFDFVFTVSDAIDDIDTSASWQEPMVWVGRKDLVNELDRPLRLLAFAEGCPYRALMREVLSKAQQPYEIIYTSQSQTTLQAALTSGFGITALPERALGARELILGRSYRLPVLPNLPAGIYLSRKMEDPEAIPLARRFADLLKTTYQRVA